MATQLQTTEPQGDANITVLRSQLETRAKELKMALPSHITPEKFQRTVTTAALQNPKILTASRQSLIMACMKAAQDGLLPDGREAALVPFKQSYKEGNQWLSRELVQYIPMVYGLRKKILQVTDRDGNPVVRSLSVGVVYRQEVEEGRFLFEEGLDPPIRFRPMLDLDEKQSRDSEIVAAYSIATMADGTKSVEVMRRFEIDKVQNLSQTGAKIDKFGKAQTPKGPWAEWYPEMAKKTVMRRHSKTLPMTGDVILDLGTDEDADDAGASTAALLGGTPGGEPVAIEDQRDEVAHDKETGEIQDGKGGEPAKDPPAESKPKAQPKAKAEPKAKETPPAEQKPETPSEPAKDPAPPQQQAGDPGPQPEGEPAAADDDLSPSEKAAQSWIESFDKCETIVDLDRLYRLSASDRSAMDGDLRDGVEKAHDDAEARLKGRG